MSIEKEELRELEEAGWRPVERLGEVVWQHPGSGYLYPQEVALRLARGDA